MPQKESPSFEIGKKRLPSAWAFTVITGAVLSVILTLYLAPSKYPIADLIAAFSLVIFLGMFGWHRSGIAAGCKPLTPLIFMLLYVAALAFSNGTEDGAQTYIKELIFGFLPFFLLYVVFRNQVPEREPSLLLALFLIPGVVHLAFMYLDVFVALQKGNIPFSSSSKQGMLEYIKDAPRVGRRYLSWALLHLLCAGWLMTWRHKHARARYLAGAMTGLSILSLALLDARAAYASVAFSGAVLIFVIGPGTAWRKIRPYLPTGLGRIVLVCFFMVVVGLGYSAGKSRWISMSYSIKAATHDVFDSQVELSQRPFVDESYWSAPIKDINACYLEGHFRCKVDQSAYLRTAWILTGMQSLWDHPFGIGYSDDYMGRLWGVAGEPGKFQRGDNFLVQHVVSFGVFSLLFYAWVIWGVLRSTRRAIRSGRASVSLVTLCAIILVCAGRGLVDVFSEGLWRYFMALLGMYYGLLHSSARTISNDLR
ncbi:hypothetical protein [Herbaspirillum robiniae]|uniref:Uncharacterized protein n=1 Tax=Herbaspirillum robiniae TaxID=2014887 RepID=A0A246WLT4_9BURK|nr:hypothetical protein [Herbaspirillum robiniae]OWY27297.1 hypothetical protein CEJ42_19775 [Herbaspirillum robiniae]